MRKTEAELNAIKKENNVDVLWSWSRISSWHTSKYEWFLNYVLKTEADNATSIYGTAGNICHDIIEQFYNKEIKYFDMINKFKDGWIVARDICQLKFDRNNPEQDEKIGDRYAENLTCFFQNHIPLNYDLHTEDFALIKVDKNYLQGYIDAWYKDENDDIYICDWKTSSIYKGDNLIEKSGQLVCYAMYFMQQGIPLEKIHAKFNFLKYCTISYSTSKGTLKETITERRLLGEKLQTPCKIWLKKCGYDVDEYLKRVLDTGSIECLPQEVQEKITITDCWVEVPINNDIIEMWQNRICDIIKEIESAQIMYEMFNDDSGFHDTMKHIKEQSYYFANLSDYSANKNKDYQKYLENNFGIFE